MCSPDRPLAKPPPICYLLLRQDVRIKRASVPTLRRGRTALKKRRLTSRVAFIVTLAAVVVLSAWLLFDRLHEDRLNRLFTGPEKHSPGPPTGFTSKIEYDVGDAKRETPKDAAATSGDVWHTDAVTGASLSIRVTAPSAYRERLRREFLTVTYPSEGALFPPNLCAPFVEWTDVHNNLWQVTIRLPDKSTWTRLSRTRRWRVPEAVWQTLVERAGDADVTLVVKGVACSGTRRKTRASVHVSQTVRFRIARHPADNAIVYRLVAPPFINRKTPDTFVRDLRELTPRPFLRARRQYCINCHMFSSKTGRDGKLGIQVRYAGARSTAHPIYLAVADFDTGRIVKTVLPFRLQMTTFMSWSPDGTKLAVSANQTLISLAPMVLEAQNTLQHGSDIAIVDLDAGQSFLLKGARDPDLLETFPRWTPDGKSIVFCEAPQRLHPKNTKYSLKIVPFADGHGGEAEMLIDANVTGRSSYYPRFSPDGRWFTFVQSDFGSLIKSSSDIFIVDWQNRERTGIRATPLTSNATFAADSWYSWSSNSRWIVFATKRDDGVFARLYMTHIDDDGNASVPVRLPLAEEPLMSFNIPEFVAEVPDVRERTLFEGLRVERPAVTIRRGEEEPRE